MPYEMFKDRKGEFRFRLKAENGEIVLASEGYKRRAEQERDRLGTEKRQQWGFLRSA